MTVMLDMPVEGVNCSIEKSTLILHSERLLKVLSSAVLNGGMREAHTIINYHTPKDFEKPDPEGFLKHVAQGMGLHKPIVGMMTAATVENAAVVTKSSNGLTLSVIVTAGVSNLATAGDIVTANFRENGTINMILLVDGNPTESCLVNTVATATEAKTVALRNLDLRSPYSGEVASGTTTDAIVVACTRHGKKVEYAGTATTLGRLVGLSVREAVAEAVRKQDGITPSRPLITRLEERRIGIEEYANHVVREGGFSKGLKEAFYKALLDVNVAAFVSAGLRLEEDLENGLIPRLTYREFTEDLSWFVADKLMALALADYVATPKNVLKRQVYRERVKTILSEHHSVIDKVLKGILTGLKQHQKT